VAAREGRKAATENRSNGYEIRKHHEFQLAWKTGGVRRDYVGHGRARVRDGMADGREQEFGYTMKIPAQFQRQGEETETSTWIYQPGSAPAAAAPAAESKGRRQREETRQRDWRLIRR